MEPGRRIRASTDQFDRAGVECPTLRIEDEVCRLGEGDVRRVPAREMQIGCLEPLAPCTGKQVCARQARRICRRTIVIVDDQHGGECFLEHGSPKPSAPQVFVDRRFQNVRLL